MDNRDLVGELKHDVGVSARTETKATITPASPDARRRASTTWRDPRLAIGVALVAVSVLLGATLLADADNMVPVWAAKSDLRAGAPVTVDDLVRQEVRFSDSSDADRYLSATSRLPKGATVARDIGAGEMLPRAALGSADAPGLVEVPVAAAADAIPVTVDVGSTVDVWVIPEQPEAEVASAESKLVFDDVTVVAAPTTGSALGPSATRQIIVGVPDGNEEGLALVLGQTVTGTILVTRND